MLSKVLFYCLLFQSLSLGSKEFNTFQKELPLPFFYFENLYFKTNSHAFLGVNNLSHQKMAIDSGRNRGYLFANVRKPLKYANHIKGTTLFLFEINEMKASSKHFFHILEHLLGIWSYYADEHFQDVRLIVLASNGESRDRFTWEGTNEMNEHLLKALFPNAEVRPWWAFIKKSQNKTLCFERAITSDRALTLYSSECTQMNKMLGVARHTLSKDALEHLAHRVHIYAKTEIRKADRLRVTYVKRSPPRALDPSVEEELFSSIKMLSYVSLRVEDFAKISFSEQIDIIANTDVLIGVHGNGLSHILFLPPNAKVIEIFPPGAHTVDYRLFADARGLDYTGIISDKGIIEKEDSYRLGLFGKINDGIHKLDINLILSKLNMYIESFNKID